MRYTASISALFHVAGRIAILAAVLSAYAGQAFSGVSMANDPHGFHDLPWGAPLTGVPELTIMLEGPHITDYKFRDRPPAYADIPVDTLYLSTVDDQFARVTIRYRGTETHAQVLQFLERSYGVIERLPGQMMRGLNQQYTWRGPETEISLTYEAGRDRGFLFIESRNLAPRFQDQLSDTAD
ncbi:MAG: exported protein of unknown function [Nitrospira sp.]|jgi:hypothetical protein|nr:exported protein of unknown function [Nitrospira sp.]